MDVVLIASSAALSYAVPVKGAFETNLMPVKVILLLSFFLFSLSIVDATPAGWLLLLTHPSPDDTGESVSFRSVGSAYYLVLWSMVLAIFLVHPSMIGARLCGRLFPPRRYDKNGAVDDENEKKKQRSLAVHMSAGRWFCIVRLLLLLIRVASRLVGSMVSIFAGGIHIMTRKIIPTQKARPILVLTRNDAKPRRSYLSSVAVVGGSRLKTAIMGCLLGTTFTYFLLHLIALPVMVPPVTLQTPLARYVSLMTALGIVISSVLNGFGSVSMPYSCLAGLFLEPIRPEAMALAERELQKAMNSLSDRKADLSSVSVHVNKVAEFAGRRKGAIHFGDVGDEVTYRRKLLSDEISVMESLVEEMKNDLVEMRDSQYMAAMSRTPVGMLRSWLGIAFSLILIVRLVSASMEILPRFGRGTLDKQPRVDIITKLLIWSQISSHDAELLSQWISLVLTAFLSCSQVRYFLRTVTTVSSWLAGLYNKVCCRNDKKNILDQRSNGIFAPMLAGCMGCYFLAANVLTKLMLPERYRAGFSAALGVANDAINIRMEALNSIFVLSAVASGLILGMRLGIQRQNTYRHKAWLMENNSLLDP